MTVYSTDRIEEVISLLRKGAVGAFPTDTVYGLGARADNEEAVLRVFRVKKRPQQMSLPLLLSDTAQLSLVAAEVTEAGRLLVQRFWPGGLTIVLPRSGWVSNLISGGENTVAARVPRHELTLALIRGAGVPLVGTSANLSGRPSPLNAREVISQIGNAVDFVLDGGNAPGGVESTVVDATGSQPVITRRGAVSEETIACFLRSKGIELANSMRG